MSKPDLTPEIEDVLTSIRRLVSGETIEAQKTPEEQATSVRSLYKSPDAAEDSPPVEETESTIADDFAADLAEDSDCESVSDVQVLHSTELTVEEEIATSTNDEDHAPSVETEEKADALLLSPALRVAAPIEDSKRTEAKRASVADLWDRVGKVLEEADATWEADGGDPALKPHVSLPPNLPETQAKSIPAFVRAMEGKGLTSIPAEERIPSEAYQSSEPATESTVSEIDSHADQSSIEADLALELEQIDEAFATQKLAEEAPALVPEIDWEEALQPIVPEISETVVDVIQTQAPPLDEEALKALVADLVREELQGALGERITRNVRKLVRREIQRALAAQAFD